MEAPSPSGGQPRAGDRKVEPAPGERKPPFRLGAMPGNILGLAPFGVYTILFLLVPAIAVGAGAFSSRIVFPKNGNQYTVHGFTWANIDTITSGVYLKSFETSIELSALAAVIPGVIGILIAYTVHMSSPRSPLRRIVATASGVFANFGGIPLAFLFIASIGSTGVATNWLGDLGFNPYDHGFTIYNLTGITIVYGYFQIPLMVLIITPAIEGLKPAWREASSSLGGGAWAYWRHVGGPVLFPAAFSSVLLLFGAALSSYATAYALSSAANLVPIQIKNVINGNVLLNPPVGDALGLGMIVIIAVMMVFYVIFQRRATKWSR